MEEPVRLSKLMSQRGICSRREADRFIEQGLVLVNGKTVDTLGTRVSPDAQIQLADEGDKHQNSLMTFLLNKPVGFVSAQAEKSYRPAVTLIRRENWFRNNVEGQAPDVRQLKGVAPAGRLDIDSHGLLILTQDGRVAKKLIAPDSTIEKEYIVRVVGDITKARLKSLRSGLRLDGRDLKPATVEQRSKAGELTFILTEGRKRQIRRMCDMVGLNVVSLRRVRIGTVELGALPSGKWRLLQPDEDFE